ncbi:unnamed protein product [Alopecurus aequalis]
MLAMDCVIHVVLGVVMRRTICRLHEVVAMVVELGSALQVAVRFSRSVFPWTTVPPSMSGPGSTHYYYYAPVAASMAGISRLDRH